MFNNVEIILLLRLLLGSQEKEQVQSINNDEVIKTYFYKKSKGDKTVFVVSLLDKEDSSIQPLKKDDYHNISLKMYDEEEINSFLNSFKKDKNYVVKFKYPRNKKVLKDFAVDFLFRLDKKKIDSVEIKYYYKNLEVDLFYGPYLWNKIYDNELYIITRSEDEDGGIIEKRRISKEYFTNVMHTHYDVNYKNSFPLEIGDTIKKYFLNQKLIFIDLDYLNDEGNNLFKFGDGKISVSDLIPYKFNRMNLHKQTIDSESIGGVSFNMYISFLFYFLKDSDIFINEIKRNMKQKGLKNSRLLLEILMKFKINNLNPSDIISNMEDYLNSEIVDINEYLENKIVKKINEVSIKDSEEEYKELLLYFYCFTENSSDKKLKHIKLFMKEFSGVLNLKKIYYSVIKEINQNISRIYNNRYKAFNFPKKCSSAFIGFHKIKIKKINSFD